MIGRLLKMLVTEAPEELSVCEFDCSVTKCTFRDAAECNLRDQATMHGSVLTRYNTPIASTEAPAAATFTNSLLCSS